MIHVATYEYHSHHFKPASAREVVSYVKVVLKSATFLDS